MATKKTAAKKPGTANAMKAAAKWRADVDAHASGAEIAITKGLPNDALGLEDCRDIRDGVRRWLSNRSARGGPHRLHLGFVCESHAAG